METRKLSESDILKLCKSLLDNWASRFKIPSPDVRVAREGDICFFDYKTNTVVLDSYPLIKTVMAHIEALPALEYALAHEFGHAVSLHRHGLSWFQEKLKSGFAEAEREADDVAEQLSVLSGQQAWDILESYLPKKYDKLDRAVHHLGYKPGSLTEEEKRRLVQDSQRRLAGVKPLRDSDLTPSQLSTLMLVRAITKQKVYAADIPPASDRVITAGMYSRSTQKIYISPEQLERGREAVSTVIHELAHHTSGAEDGEPEHASEIAKLADQVVIAVKRGDYDRHLSGAFVW